MLAGAEGFEPPSTVLETAILPLNYAPEQSEAIFTLFSINPKFLLPVRRLRYDRLRG